MISSRHIILLASLSLLAACGDKDQQPVAETPVAPAAETVTTTEPTAATTETAPEAAPSGGSVDASSLYASRCASCHGETAEGVAGNPGLTKLSRADVQSRLETYRSGGTVGAKSAIMKGIAGKLSDEEIAALSVYLGS
jgi:cytochrome c553